MEELSEIDVFAAAPRLRQSSHGLRMAKDGKDTEGIDVMRHNPSEQESTAWVNMRLERSGHSPIDSITEDFKSGVNLGNLVNSLMPAARVRTRDSENVMVKRDNVQKCLDAIDKTLKVPGIDQYGTILRAHSNVALIVALLVCGRYLQWQ